VCCDTWFDICVFISLCVLVIINKFWEEVAHSGQSTSLIDILELLSSTDYGNVVMFAR
jgi:hypothetical protein